MSTFLTGSELENKLTDIIWNAKKYIVIISPFIKLDDHMTAVLEKVKSDHRISLYIVFGKNEEYKHKSFNEKDFNFIKDFKNVTILYNKDLHAKYYANESEGLITSLNLYGYSMVNNIEYGVYFSKTILNPVDKVYDQTFQFTYDLINNQSEVVYLKKPQYSKRLLGLTKQYQESNVLFNISDEFFNGYNHEVKQLSDFDLEQETTFEKKFGQKPQRHVEDRSSDFNYKKAYDSNYKMGYCIRTGEEIPYDLDKPMSYDAWRTWSNFMDYDYPENYCHSSGKRSNGRTSMRRPTLII